MPPSSGTGRPRPEPYDDGRFDIFGRLRDRFLAADPGFTRLTLAAHVTLAVALTVVATAIGAAAYDVSITVAILGAIVAMQASLAISDADPRTTTLLAALPGIAGTVLGAIFSSRGLLADAVFLVVLFAAVAVRTRGQRWTAFGTIAMMTYFFTLFLGARIDQLPALTAAVVIAIAVTYVVRFVLLPERAGWIARRMIDAFEARVRFVAGAAADLLEARDPGRARQHLAAMIGRLNETASAIETRLGEQATEHLRTIFETELAAEELAAEARALRDAAAVPPRALRLALSALRRGRASRAARIAERVLHGEGYVHPAARAAAAAAIDLASTIVRVESVAPALALSGGPWGGTGGAQQPVMRQAVQVTAASAVAIVVGEILSPQRWYWAVLATYFVFIGTASSGETFARAWARVGGTALGVAAGILVARLAEGHPWLDIAAIFVCLFSGVYFLRISYLMMIFFITALLALLYTALGNFSDALLAIRLTETAVGAICGGIAATVILPTRTHDVVRASARDALDAAQETIHTSIARLLHPEVPDEPLTSAHVLEERVLVFVRRAKPATSTPALIGRGHELRRWIVSLSACNYYARLLARTADRAVEPPGSAAGEALARIDDILRANIDAARERIDGRFERGTQSTLPYVEVLRTHIESHGDAELVFRSAGYLLERLDRTIARLARPDGTITETV